MRILMTGMGMIGNALNRHLSRRHAIVPFTGDIRDFREWDKYKHISFDCVIHLAGLSNISESIKNPDLYWDVNVRGSCEAFKFCRSQNLKCLYASSSNAKEWYTNPYATTKKAVEQIARDTLPNQSIGIRIHTVWPGRDDMLFKRIERGDVTYINTNHTRDWIHIDDLATAVETILDNWGELVSKEVLDVGCGVSISNKDVYEKYGKGRVEYITDPTPNERQSTLADVDWLYDLDWKPNNPIL